MNVIWWCVTVVCHWPCQMPCMIVVCNCVETAKTRENWMWLCRLWFRSARLKSSVLRVGFHLSENLSDPCCCTLRIYSEKYLWPVTRGLSRSIAVGGGALAFFGRRRRRAEAPPSAAAAPAIDRRRRRGAAWQSNYQLPSSILHTFNSHIILYAYVCLFVTKMNK